MVNANLVGVPWINRAFSQMLIVGAICFCCPGMFNAMQALGNAGGDDPVISSTMSAVLYGCFAIFGYFGGFFFNVFGNRLLMASGGATYALYALGVYLWGKSSSMAWFAITASAALGIGAGFLWTAQGAMIMSYATEDRKGLYGSTFWVIFNAGGLFGGLLTFIMNFSSDNGSVSAASYFTFIGVMCAGAVMSLILLVSPSKVVRDDGKPIVFEESPGPMYELTSVFRLFGNKNMLLLIPLIIQSNWFYTYEFGGFNGLLFNARTRGFNSAMYWGAQMIGAKAIGYFLDSKGMTRSRRAVLALVGVTVINSAQWVWAIIMSYTWEGGYDRNRTPSDVPANGGPVDIADGGRFFLPFGLFIVMGLCDSMVQNYAYWLMGALANGPDECARYAGFYKGVQSFGAMIAWIIDAKSTMYRTQLWICVILSLVFVPPTFLVASWITETNNVVSGETDLGSAEEKDVYTQEYNPGVDSATSPYMMPATQMPQGMYADPMQMQAPQYYQ